MTDLPTFARIADVKVGDVLIADDGFTCLPAGAECEVRYIDGDLCIACAEGWHNLEGQDGYTPETEGLYVGLYRKTEAS